MPKHFINTVEGFVDDAIEGLLRSSGGLARLDAAPGVRVVLRDPMPENRVALVSGGGSGHEPAHAGFVGAGMLSAAVCGDIFASPPVNAVLAAIRAVTGPAGCLLIVKNYTGDRLNFGLAAERARAEGYRVEMVLVAEDLALPEADQPRGLAGTLFVHKIAGAAAEAGESLEKVSTLAQRVASRARTLSLSLTGCAIPGQSNSERISSDEAEFGLGIHGEPGAQTVPLGTAYEMMEPLHDHLTKALDGAGDLALIINTLGGVPPIEAQVVTQAVLAGRIGMLTECVIGPAPLMTSLDMRGVSISALPLDGALREFLMAPTGSPAWPQARLVAQPKLIQPSHSFDEISYSASEEPTVRAVIETACSAVAGMASDLDALDAKVGDGDTGATFAAGAKDIRSKLDTLPLADTADLFEALAAILSQRAGGSSGVLLSILFAAAAGSAEAGKAPGAALRHGLERMKELGGASRGDRTMIDALEPALDRLAANEGISSAAEAARAGADYTSGLSNAAAGRSAYVPSDRLSGIPDPGAEGVARLFEALALER